LARIEDAVMSGNHGIARIGVESLCELVELEAADNKKNAKRYMRQLYKMAERYR
jgi:hypothetical protein